MHDGDARNGADLRVNRATVDETRREDTRFVLVSGLLVLDMSGLSATVAFVAFSERQCAVEDRLDNSIR